MALKTKFNQQNCSKNLFKNSGKYLHTYLQIFVGNFALSMKKVMPFILTADYTPARAGLDGDALPTVFMPPPQQLEFSFDGPSPTPEDHSASRFGEL